MNTKEEAHLCLVGDQSYEIYGLSLEEWQSRNWAKAGIEKAKGTLYVATPWVLSSGLAAALVNNPGAALVSEGAGPNRLIAAHIDDDVDLSKLEALIAAPQVSGEEIIALNLNSQTAEELAGFYNKELRKREAPFAIDIETQGLRAAEQALFDSSYKGVTDFVTKFAWPIPAFWVTRFCAKWRISPNTVTTLSLVFVLLALWFFWNGQWALGFMTGWFMTFLDTVDGKLARTTLTSSKWGNIYDHGIDLIHPPFWYFAWVEGIKANGLVLPDWIEAALWITLGGYVFGRIVEGVFIHYHGFHIHVWCRIDSVMRFITARRNPNTFIFMMFCIIGAPIAGFAAVTIWTVVSNAFHLVRLIQAGLRPAKPPLISWMTV